MITRELSLFPLHTVLFPGVSLPLHVFEERYKLLVKRCLETDHALGIVLIRSGLEVGAPAEHFEVGTLARIVRTERRADETLSLSIIGERRFRIHSIVQPEPYVVANVELLEEDVPDVSERLVANVRELFTEYVQTLRRLSRRTESTVRIPAEALELSRLVAANLQISRFEQQALLEASSTQRIRREIDLLRRELAMLQRLGAVTARRMLTPSEFSPN